MTSTGEPRLCALVVHIAVPVAHPPPFSPRNPALSPLQVIRLPSCMEEDG